MDSDHACKIFINSIAEVERRKCTEIIDKAKFVSVLSDGSTDVSVSENEIVYIHFCLEGVMNSYFARLVAVELGNAKAIVEAIKNR